MDVLCFSSGIQEAEAFVGGFVPPIKLVVGSNVDKQKGVNCLDVDEKRVL